MATLKLKLLPRSRLQGKVGIKFPASITGAGGIVVTTAGRDVTIGFNQNILEGTFEPKDNTLTAIAALDSIAGVVTQTAADTFTKRSLIGTSNQITVTNGNGILGDPTLSLPADVAIPAVITAPNTGLHILDTNASHDLIVKPGSDLTADRTLTVTTGDADRTLDISASNVTVSSYGATLIDDTSALSARATLGLVIGTDVNAAIGGWSASVQSTGFQGIDGNKLFAYNSPASFVSNDHVVRVQRNANYTGGTVGQNANALLVQHDVGANVANFEWAIASVMNNSATAGENVAGYFQGNKMATGPTWAIVCDAIDRVGTDNPTTGLIAVENTIWANGSDNNFARVNIDMRLKKWNSGGTNPVVSYGLRIGTDAGNYTNGIAFGGNGVAATVTNAIDFASATLTKIFNLTTAQQSTARGDLGMHDAWVAYTPTVSAASGTITTASATGRHRTHGKTCQFSISITITTNGTGAVTLRASLPGNAAAGHTFEARNNTDGVILHGFVNGGTNIVEIVKTDNTYPGLDGKTYILSGVVELQ